VQRSDVGQFPGGPRRVSKSPNRINRDCAGAIEEVPPHRSYPEPGGQVHHSVESPEGRSSSANVGNDGARWRWECRCSRQINGWSLTPSPRRASAPVVCRSIRFSAADDHDAVRMWKRRVVPRRVTRRNPRSKSFICENTTARREAGVQTACKTTMSRESARGDVDPVKNPGAYACSDAAGSDAGEHHVDFLCGASPLGSGWARRGGPGRGELRFSAATAKNGRTPL